MRIVLFGWFGCGSLGDEAILRCQIEAFRRRSPDISLALASFSPDAHRDLHLDVFHVRDDAALSAAIAGADLVVVGGGALWQDEQGWSPGDLFKTPEPSTIAGSARPLLMAAALGVRSALFANGVGPLCSPAARRAVASLASLATHVSVRDDESADALRAAGFMGSILVTADPAFAVVPEASAIVAPQRKPLRIGVVPSAWSVAASSGDPPHAIALALNALAAQHAMEILLLPFHGADGGASGEDDLAIERLLDALILPPDDVRTVTPSTPEEAAGWLGSCDLVVTMRLHGAVLAAVSGVPSLTISVDPALQSTARLLGLADLSLPPDSCTPQAIERGLDQALETRDAIAKSIAARVEVARTLLDAGYDAVLAVAAAPAATAPAAEAADRQREQLAAYEQVCSRLRSRLEQREESWRTLASLLGRDVETIEPVSAGITQRSRDIQILRARAETAEGELETIKRSPGWRLLNRYGRFKYRYLLPIYRLLSRLSPERPPEHHAEPTLARVPPGMFDVVCFPIIDWDFRFQRPQQLMSRFAAAGHRVFYVAPWFLEPGDAYVLEEKRPNLYRVKLRGPQRNVWTEALDAKDTDKLFASLNRLRANVALGATMVCVQLPFWWPLVAMARERFGWPIVYDCMDDHAGFSTHSGATAKHEHELFAGADLVVASSLPLEQEARRHTDKVLLLRNGCEYEHFAAVGSERHERGRRPIIGYYGAIAEWFDADLVADLAERRPDWDFVLVGSTERGNVSRLSRLPNVSLPGEKPYRQIPEWLAKLDVTLLPFKRSPLTEATNPVKAYEILAAGKPLVSVPLPEMVDLVPLVRLASTLEEFEREIVAALEPSDAELADQRRAFAKANTWQTRFETLAAVVPDLFPRASTVIVTYNNLAVNRACLDSLFARTEWPNHEVIVVDNASTDGTPEYLEAQATRLPNLSIIRNEHNLGFARACNQGLARATGEYLVLLNNDTVVSRGWLSALIRHLSAVPEIGLIGPVTNEIGNEAKVAVGYRRLEDMPAWALKFTRENDDRLRSMRMLAMFCVAMRRQTFREVGPLDERFEIGMFEDDDYSRRIETKGYRLVCARDSYVHHVGGASFKRLDQEHYRELFERNKRAYEHKWGMWTPHQDDTVLPRIEMLRARLGTIVTQAGVRADQIVVFLRSLPSPAPLVQRSHHLAEGLARSGMLVFVHGPAGGNGDGFRELKKNLWLYDGPPGTLEHLQSPILWALPYNGLDAFRWVKRTLVYDVTDDLSVFPFDEDLLRENHARMLREADIVLCASRALADEVRTRRPDAAYLPNGVADAPFKAPLESVRLDPAFEVFARHDRPIVGYFGTIAAWFDVALVLATARRRPDWAFVIIGHRLDDAPSLTELEQLDNVCVLAPQPHAALPRYLARCTAAMIPYVVNRATQAASPIELYDYLAGGTPVISTPIAECAALAEVLVAGTVEEFSSALDLARERAGDARYRDRLRALARDHTWAIRTQEIIGLLRARADEEWRPTRAQQLPTKTPARRHAATFAGQKSYRGTCNICGHFTVFYFEDPALYRESLVCGECLSTSRYRSIARGILRAIGELVGVEATSLTALADLPPQRVLRVYDTQVPFYFERNAYPIPDLLSECEWIEVQTSTYRPREPLGRLLGTRRTNQNLEMLTFPDESFDLVITSDVMEHVRVDDRAHREIRRILVPEGAYVFTLPQDRDKPKTTIRVAVTDPDDPTQDQFLIEKEYQGDANAEENQALCYRTYGRDLDSTLESLGFRVEYHKEDFPDVGIMNTELFYCRVTRAAHAVALDKAASR